MPINPTFFGPTPAETGLDVRQDLTPDAEGLLNKILGAGGGLLEETLDVFGRPFRFAGHLLGTAVGVPGSSVRQAFEQLDPFNMITPDVEAEPIRGADLFTHTLGHEGLGLVQRGDDVFGIPAEEVGGFGIEILLDPLTLFGGLLGKGAAKALKGVGGPATAYLEGLAGASKIPGLARLRGLGARTAAGLERTGGLFPAVGAGVGATLGAAKAAAEDESLVGGAVLGGALGVAGGAAVRHLPELAGKGLKAAEAVSDRFNLRGLGDDGFKRLRNVERLSQSVPEQALRQALTKQAQAERALAEAGIESTRNYLTILETPGGREVAARELGVALPEGGVGGGTVPFDVFASGDKAQAAQRLQWENRLAQAAQEGKAALRQMGQEIANEKKILGFGGTAEVASLAKQVQDMPEPVKALTRAYLGGDPDFPLLTGKFAMERELLEMGVLDRRKVDGLIARTKVAQLPHIVNTKDPVQYLQDILGKLYEHPGMQGLSLPDALRRAQSLASNVGAAGRKAMEFRALPGTIEEINAAYPNLLKDSLAELMTEDITRLASHRSMRDLVQKIGTDKEWTSSITSLAGNVDRAAAYTLVDPNRVPKHLREFFTEQVTDITPALARKITAKQGKVLSLDDALEFAKAHPDSPIGKAVARQGQVTIPKVMRTEVYDRIFGKGGVGTALFDPQTPGNFRKSWRAANRFWSRWTLGPFTSWVGRNIPSNVFNNLLAGVGLKARAKHSLDAWVAMDDYGRFFTGAATEIPEGTIKLGKTTLTRRKLVEELTSQDVLASGFLATESGLNIHRAMGPIAGLKRVGAAIRSPRQTLRDVFRLDPQQNLFSKTGFGVNAILEDHERVLHYFAKRAEGLSPLDAAHSVNVSLGDFRPGNQLVERAAELMPFIRWSAFNLPRQLRGMVENPKIISRVAGLKLSFDETNGVNVPKEIYPEWLQGQLSIPVGADEHGNFQVFALNQWLPLADLTDIETPEKFGQFLIRQLSPFISEPVTQVTGFDFFFRRFLERYPGEQEHFLGMKLSKKDAHALRVVRLISEFERSWGPALGILPGSERINEELTRIGQTAAITRAVTGAKFRPIDLARQRTRRLNDERTTIRRLTRQLREAPPGQKPAIRVQLEEARARRRFWQKWHPPRHPVAASNTG